MNKGKRCSKCTRVKRTSSFTKDRQKADGLCNWCKVCRGLDKARYYLLNADSIKLKVKAWRDSNPERKVASYRNSRYGLAPNRFDKMLERQFGKCAVCREPFTAALVPHVDHDHRCCPVGSMCCGKCVRGLLCHKCNKGLGYLQDRIDVLVNGIKYLQGDDAYYTG